LSVWEHCTFGVETLHSPNGNTVVETLHIQSGETTQSGRRHYAVIMGTLCRLETLYIQNRNTVQIGDTIQSEWKQYTGWRYYTE
jgi:hypothetical protein